MMLRLHSSIEPDDDDDATDDTHDVVLLLLLLMMMMIVQLTNVRAVTCAHKTGR